MVVVDSIVVVIDDRLFAIDGSESRVPLYGLSATPSPIPTAVLAANTRNCNRGPNANASRRTATCSCSCLFVNP